MYMRSAKILYVKGRQHPVKIYHSSEGQSDYVDSALRTFFQIHTDQPPGDVLIFLPGFFFFFLFFRLRSGPHTFSPGQEDIESLDKSIQLFANQLPQNATKVSLTPTSPSFILSF